MKKNKPTSEKSSCKEEQLIQLPRKRAMGWLVIFCFVSVWIFFLGILVGRGMAPVQFDMDALQKELTDLRMALIQKEQQLTQSDTNTLAGKPNFAFHENLKESKPDTSVTFQRKTPEPTEPSPRTKPSHKTRNITKNKQLLGKSGSPQVKRQTAPPAAQPSTDKPLTIQIASLRDPKIADQLVASLRKKGVPAYKTIGVISENNVWYRVRAGHFSRKADSHTMMAKIKKEHKGAILLKR